MTENLYYHTVGRNVLVYQTTKTIDDDNRGFTANVFTVVGPRHRGRKFEDENSRGDF